MNIQNYNKKIQEDLIKAIENGNLDKIKLLVEEGFNIYEKNGILEYLVLDTAICSNQLEVVKYLIEGNKYIVSQSSINLCIDEKNFEILKYLINENTVFSIENFDRVGQYGSVEIFKFMIEHAVKNEYERFDFFISAFIEALNNENLNLIKYLVSLEPGLIEYDDYFCLRSSVESDNVEITEFLLDNDADITVAQDFVVQHSNVYEYLKRRPLEKKLNKELSEKESAIKKIKV